MAQASVAAPAAAPLARSVWVLLAKEVRIELRSKETVPSMAVFALAALVTFQFAFDLRGPTLSLVAPGILWVAVLFASILGLGRSFAREVERGSLEGLLASPVDAGALYLAKLLGNLALLLTLEAAIIPLGAVLFGLDLLRPGLLLFLPLGSWGIAAVGTILAAMAANTRAREALLPILVLPLLVPVVIAGVKGTGLALDGRPWAELQVWAGLLASYDLLFTTLSYLTFHIVVEQ